MREGTLVQGGKRVLLVEDDHDTGEVFALLLQLSGHVVHHAPCGTDALDAVTAFAPDAAVIDFELPDMDGPTLANRLRAAFPAIRLVATSGYSSAAHVAASLTAGFEAFLVKPIEPDELLGYLR